MYAVKRISAIVIFALLSTIAAVIGGEAQAQTTVPSLQGEQFSGDLRPYESNCDADGGTITFTSTGTATGPYPGTYVETVTVVLGPETASLGPNLIPRREVLSAEASFTIDSPVGQVTGTKTLSPPSGLSGLCGAGPQEAADEVCAQFGRTGESVTRETASAWMTYEAEIQTVAGGYSDSGRASLSFVRFIARCSANFVTVSEGFNENFALSNGVVPLETTGAAQGGGQLEHPQGTNAQDAVTFGFNVSNNLRDGIRGNCNVVDVDLDLHITCDTVTSYSQAGRTAMFSGTATVTDAANPHGYTTSYRISVTDIDESGIGTDSFSITTDDGYVATGLLTEGNVQVCDQQGQTTCGTPVL